MSTSTPHSCELVEPHHVFRYDVIVIMDILENDCSLYVYEIREMLILRGGTDLSNSTIKYWLKKLGFRHKKVWKYARRARLIQEIAYWEYMASKQYHITQLVFFDESSVNKRNSNRRYGWSRRGRRSVFRYLQRARERYSLLAAVDYRGVFDYGIIKDTCNSHKLLNFFINSLMLKMNAFPGPRSVLILDNASIHHYEPFKRVAAFVGIRLVYLPPYSPHLNIIELFFNAFKRSLEKYRLLTQNAPLVAMAAICEQYRDYNVRGALEQAGYLRYCRSQ